jgi:hypothetical protein
MTFCINLLIFIFCVFPAIFAFVPLISVQYPGNQRMPHHVPGIEKGETDAVFILQDVYDMTQT